jgi:hypothetical protein
MTTTASALKGKAKGAAMTTPQAGPSAAAVKIACKVSGLLFEFYHDAEIPLAQQMAQIIDAALAAERQRAAKLVEAAEAALPNLHWANIHGSRCDGVIEDLAAALAEWKEAHSGK